MTCLDIAAVRPVIESEIHRLIAILDMLEPDPDFENGADLEEDTADLESLLGAPKDMQDNNHSLEQRLETMRELNEEILTTSGPDGHVEHLRGMREIEDKIITFNTAIGILKKRIDEAAERESIESVKSKAKSWPADAKLEFELRDKALKSVLDAFAVLGDYRSAREKNMSWRSTIGRADALGLKPVDPLGEVLAKANRPHPVNDPALYQALQAAANFKAELEELGVRSA